MGLQNDTEKTPAQHSTEDATASSVEPVSCETGEYHQRLLAGIMNNLLGGIVTIDMHGTMLTVNRATIELTGYSKDELLGKNITMLMGEHIAREHDGYVKGFSSKSDNVVGKKRYLQVYRKDGGFFLAEIAVSKMTLDGEIVFIGSIYDVTEKVEQDKKIWELARFPAESVNPVMKIGSSGEISYANGCCQPILELWQALETATVPADILALVNKCVSSGNKHEIIIETCNGIFYKLVFAPVPDLKSAYVYGMDISQTVKDQRELETHRTMLEEMVKVRTEEAINARHEAERANQAKSLFLANMSHEIRTPLSAIIGFAELLLEEGTSRKELESSVRTIIRSGEHLKEMINDVLDLSKIEANMLELENAPVNYFSVLSDVLALARNLNRDKPLQFDLEYEFPLPKVIDTDIVRFRQILLNLCSNSVKFTEQGAVTIKVQYLPRLAALAISVIDTGIGMTAGQLQRIFEPFVQADITTTRKYGGTGLGLSLSRCLSELLGGDLTVTSEEGKGSCFTLRIPISREQKTVELINEYVEETTEASVDATPQQAQLSGHVLLVEDTPALQVLVERYLKKFGLEVSLAVNGAEAVNKALARPYSVILMDMQMPVMDGYTATRELREQGYEGPIVALTANAMQEDKKRSLRAGCNDFLTKPIQNEQLYRSLSKYLADGREEPNGTMVSSLFTTDPDMVNLVGMFLDNLPDYIKQCREALSVADHDALTHILHTLKGMGGSYGYDIISRLAEEAENKLKGKDLVSVAALVEKLAELNELAQRDYRQRMNLRAGSQFSG
ncbi:MAG: ATP-binding protein [Gammaproteobacteria bacterium]|nr:ATP-binding protein [Gammaproteobacteria bacterium]